MALGYDLGNAADDILGDASLVDLEAVCKKDQKLIKEENQRIRGLGFLVCKTYQKLAELRSRPRPEPRPDVLPGFLNCQFCYHEVPPEMELEGLCSCRTVGYCSKECQKLDWDRCHKYLCWDAHSDTYSETESEGDAETQSEGKERESPGDDDDQGAPDGSQKHGKNTESSVPHNRAYLNFLGRSVLRRLVDIRLVELQEFNRNQRKWIQEIKQCVRELRLRTDELQQELAQHQISPRPGPRPNVSLHFLNCQFCYREVSREMEWKGLCSCGTVRYCSKQCQMLDWDRHHQSDCPKAVSE